MDFDEVTTAAWFALIYLLQFGIPRFEIVPIITTCIVMVVMMIESAGMFSCPSGITGRTIDRADMSRGLAHRRSRHPDWGSLFNTFPYTSFSQNVGLVGVAGVKSRYVCVVVGIIVLIMGLVGALVECVPLLVLAIACR